MAWNDRDFIGIADRSRCISSHDAGLSSGLAGRGSLTESGGVGDSCFFCRPAAPKARLPPCTPAPRRAAGRADEGAAGADEVPRRQCELRAAAPDRGAQGAPARVQGAGLRRAGAVHALRRGRGRRAAGPSRTHQHPKACSLPPRPADVPSPSPSLFVVWCGTTGTERAPVVGTLECERYAKLFLLARSLALHTARKPFLVLHTVCSIIPGAGGGRTIIVYAMTKSLWLAQAYASRDE